MCNETLGKLWTEENIWDEFTKMNKKVPSMESLIKNTRELNSLTSLVYCNWWVFSLLSKNCQKFCFEYLAKNSSLIGDITAVFSKFTKFPVAIVGRRGAKRFLHVT